MCFSATASFGSSVVLLTIGAVCVKKAETKGQYLLSAIPIFFCLQQFIEGVVWVSLQNPEYRYLEKLATYSFLIFAQVIWPTIVPLTVLMIEPEEKKRKALKVFLTIGTCISAVFLVFLAIYPVQAVIIGYHIKYEVSFPLSHTPFAGLIYLIPTLVPPILSGIRPMRWLGLLLLVSFIITTLLYKEYLISVWCYFAALMSILVLYIIHYKQRNRVSPIPSSG